MATHGRYREPCPRCGAKIQRIRYAANETNYCPNCQTGGKLLADRALSRLLREDWPKRAEELSSSRKLAVLTQSTIYHQTIWFSQHTGPGKCEEFGVSGAIAASQSLLKRRARFVSPTKYQKKEFHE